jgi:splicing factor 3B subunit 5
MNERFSLQNQIEHLNTKYTGTGNPDTKKWEYGTNLRRDALASHISHYSRMMYFSAIEN